VEIKFARAGVKVRACVMTKIYFFEFHEAGYAPFKEIFGEAI